MDLLYEDEIRRHTVVFYATTNRDEYILMDNTRHHRVHLVDNFLSDEEIVEMDSASSVWYMLGRNEECLLSFQEAIQHMENSFL